MIVKNIEEKKILEAGGKILASILQEVALLAKPGISTFELDQKAEFLIRKNGGEPAFLNYRPHGAPRSYPASLCVSLNNEVVHGIPKKDIYLKEGDLVSLDLGLKFKGLFTDSAITVPVGEISFEDKKLIATAKNSLEAGIWEAVVGNTTADIGGAIEDFVKQAGFFVVKELSGHGVGKKVHENPYVPNFRIKGGGEKLISNLVIAIEPMVNKKSSEVILLADGYTYITKDKERSAHFEHTIIITDNGPEILTKI